VNDDGVSDLLLLYDAVPDWLLLLLCDAGPATAAAAARRTYARRPHPPAPTAGIAPVLTSDSHMLLPMLIV
jgi:hypothetical protein